MQNNLFKNMSALIKVGIMLSLLWIITLACVSIEMGKGLEFLPWFIGVPPLLIIWGIYMAIDGSFKNKEARARARVLALEKKPLVGLGGWLTLVAFKLLMNISYIVVWLIGASGVLQKLFIFFLLLYFVFLAISFFREKKYFPKLMIFTYIAILILNILAGFLSGWQAPMLAITALTFLNAMIWVPYFLVSKRVKNTFLL